MIGATGKQGLLLNNGNKDNNNTATALSSEGNKSPVPARKKVSFGCCFVFLCVHKQMDIDKGIVVDTDRCHRMIIVILNPLQQRSHNMLQNIKNKRGLELLS